MSNMHCESLVDLFPRLRNVDQWGLRGEQVLPGSGGQLESEDSCQSWCDRFHLNFTERASRGNPVPGDEEAGVHLRRGRKISMHAAGAGLRRDQRAAQPRSELKA